MKSKLMVLLVTIIFICVTEIFGQNKQALIIAYPIPFNPRKHFLLKIDDQGAFSSISWININIYDINGDKCHSSKSFAFPVTWNGRNSTGNTISPGMYIIKVEVEETSGYYGKKLIRLLVNY